MVWSKTNVRMFIVILLRALRVNKSRVFALFCSLALGTGVITALLNVYFDISAKMSRELRTYGANIFIGPSDAASAPARALDLELYDNLRKEMPAGRLVGMSAYLYGIVKLDEGEAVVAGMNFSEVRKISPFWRITGSWITMDFDERNCLIGKELARKLKLNPGDEIAVHTGGARRLINVKGIVESGQMEDEQILVNLSLAGKILGQPGTMNHILISLVTDGLDLEAFSGNLQDNHDRITVKPIRKLSYAEAGVLEKISGMMSIIAVIILALTALSMMTTMVSIILERSREIGLMKALGAPNYTIISQFLVEIVIIDGFGSGAGIVAGMVIAQIIGRTVFMDSISFRFMVLPIIFFLSMFASLASSIIPVRIAYNLDPAVVLRGE